MTACGDRGALWQGLTFEKLVVDKSRNLVSPLGNWVPFSLPACSDNERGTEG